MGEKNRGQVNAELARLIAETQKLSEESARMSLESQKLMAGACRVKLRRLWYPMAVACCSVLTIAALTILLMEALRYWY